MILIKTREKVKSLLQRDKENGFRVGILELQSVQEIGKK